MAANNKFYFWEALFNAYPTQFIYRFYECFDCCVVTCGCCFTILYCFMWETGEDGKPRPDCVLNSLALSVVLTGLALITAMWISVYVGMLLMAIGFGSYYIYYYTCGPGKEVDRALSRIPKKTIEQAILETGDKPVRIVRIMDAIKSKSAVEAFNMATELRPANEMSSDSSFCVVSWQWDAPFAVVDKQYTNGRVMSILKKLRAKKFKYAWIDALCLDQLDTDVEKRYDELNSLRFLYRDSIVKIFPTNPIVGGEAVDDSYLVRLWVRAEMSHYFQNRKFKFEEMFQSTDIATSISWTIELLSQLGIFARKDIDEAIEKGGVRIVAELMQRLVSLIDADQQELGTLLVSLFLIYGEVRIWSGFLQLLLQSDQVAALIRLSVLNWGTENGTIVQVFCSQQTDRLRATKVLGLTIPPEVDLSSPLTSMLCLMMNLILHDVPIYFGPKVYLNYITDPTTYTDGRFLMKVSMSSKTLVVVERPGCYEYQLLSDNSSTGSDLMNAMRMTNPRDLSVALNLPTTQSYDTFDELKAKYKVNEEAEQMRIYVASIKHLVLTITDEERTRLLTEAQEEVKRQLLPERASAPGNDSPAAKATDNREPGANNELVVATAPDNV